ncbi:MAG: DUF6502 family protein [Woeseiaceae bacterium]
MTDNIKKRVLDAFLLVMRPIVRILLRYGIGYREFAEVTKTAFVDIASSDFGIRGRPTNISRIAVMTGLTRKEVRRIKDKIATGDALVSVRTTPFEDVLHQWHAQSDFTDSAGNPKPLRFAGNTSSFTDLVKRFGGDIPAGAMRTEMKRVGVIKEDDSGLLTVVNRTYRPESDQETLITILVRSVYPLLSNVAHNTNPDREGATWVNRVAHTTSLRMTDSKQLHRITKDRIVDFVEAIDDIFIAYESLQDDVKIDPSRSAVAVGVFYFEEQDKNAEYEW